MKFNLRIISIQLVTYAFVLIFLGCNEKNIIVISLDNFFPIEDKNTQYIYHYSEDKLSNNSGKFITTIIDKDKDCIKVKDTFKLNKNKILNPLSYQICYWDRNIIIKTTSNEFIQISHMKTWNSKVFSYYHIPKERAFVQECRVTKEFKEKVLNHFLDILEVECIYTNDVNAKIMNIYKYAATIGMIEKIEMVEGIEISRLKLERIIKLGD